MTKAEGGLGPSVSRDGPPVWEADPRITPSQGKGSNVTTTRLTRSWEASGGGTEDATLIEVANKNGAKRRWVQLADGEFELRTD